MSVAHPFTLTACALVFGAASLEAQVVQPKPTLPPLLQDTIIVSSFSLVGGPPYLLKNTLLGKAPSHFRVSGLSSFKGAAWISWPSSNLPTWSGAGGSNGACGPETVKVVGHFQVRAVKSFGSGGEGVTSFVHSNVARDTLCIPFG